MSHQILLLLVDDDDVDREMIRRSLRILDATIVEAQTGQECLRVIQEKVFDLILLDYKLPDCNGLDLVPQIRSLGTLAPIIMVTGFGSDDLVIDTIKAGIMDYVPKNQITPEFLTRAVVHTLSMYKAQVDKQKAEMQYRALYDMAPIGLFRTKLEDGTFLNANICCARLLGFKSPEQLIGKKSTDIYNVSARAAMLERLRVNGVVNDHEVHLTLESGQVVWGRVTAVLNQQEGVIDGCLVDITQLKEIEATLIENNKELMAKLSGICASAQERLGQL